MTEGQRAKGSDSKERIAMVASKVAGKGRDLQIKEGGNCRMDVKGLLKRSPETVGQKESKVLSGCARSGPR